MKKLFLFICIAIGLITLCSCNDTRIIEIDNVIWKNDDFNIVATSRQLQKQSNNQHSPGDDDYYSSITLFDVKYFCEIHIENGNFNLNLYNSSNSSKIYFFGESEEFLWGHYSNDDFLKVKDKEYKYTLSISLKNVGQYYEYCSENDIIL
ncbi:MAG: hypothetical protein K6G28_00070 [Acholeplasmatales bacterium]|nr:hypothetical protein [Acholeplasmatales bacterium]